MRVHAWLIALCLTVGCAHARPPAAGAPWLVVSDLHFDPRLGGDAPSGPGQDSNLALLDSTLAAMQRVAPDAPVVVIPGDFLAHHLPAALATSSLQLLAARFDAAFPRAQFVIALGNNDSDCGDYTVPRDGPFLQAVADAWAPLVNRGGAAPRFAAQFAHDGSYVAALPVPHLRALVVHDTLWSVRAACPGAPGGEASGEAAVEALAALLAGEPADARRWVVMHIPLGFDPYRSPPGRGAVPTPFLEPAAGAALSALLEQPGTELIVTAHVHRFGYRHHRAPMLMAPAVSPVFRNAPSFLALDVGPDGRVANAAEYSLSGGAWTRLGDLAGLGVAAFSVEALTDLDARLAGDPALRQRFLQLSQAGAPALDDGDQRGAACAAAHFDADAYARCASAP
jgi:hypothetical protein